jgi:hypothetical protein
MQYRRSSLLAHHSLQPMSQPYSTSWFRNPPSSESLPLSSLDSDSIPPSESSIYTTTTSHTVPGIGSLSGKFIHGFGKRVLRGFESVVIRRRLSHIESLCPLSDNNPPPDVKSLYDDLLELARCVIVHPPVIKLDESDLLMPLCRPGLYSSNIGNKSLGLLCGQIQRSETHYLMESLRKWTSHERTFILCEILYATLMNVILWSLHIQTENVFSLPSS